ncbi:hypothetical protein B566_EDAN019461, partial [Ephemera danica]
PGDRICNIRDGEPALGTYAHGTTAIRASLVGKVNDYGEGLPVVLPCKPRPGIPVANSIIIGRVRRITPRNATVSILLVDDLPVRDEFDGLLRIENVRDFEVDKLVMRDCFRPGDIIRAKVLAVGDSHAYLLSTAGDYFGVLCAQSAAGANMFPVSWESMQCPDTGGCSGVSRILFREAPMPELSCLTVTAIVFVQPSPRAPSPAPGIHPSFSSIVLPAA